MSDFLSVDPKFKVVKIMSYSHVFLCPSVFEQYQKARTQFVQTVAELATRPMNIEILQNAGVMSLLRPLLLDIVPTIQQTAALALGRLANYNDDLAEAVVKGDILPQLVYSLAEQNVSLRRSYDFCHRMVTYLRKFETSSCLCSASIRKLLLLCCVL